MQALSAVFLSTHKIATDQDNLTGNLTGRVLVKLSELHSARVPWHDGCRQSGLGEDTQTHTPIEYTDTPPLHNFPIQTHMGQSTANPLPLSQHLVLAVGTAQG